MQLSQKEESVSQNRYSAYEAWSMVLAVAFSAVCLTGFIVLTVCLVPTVLK